MTLAASTLEWIQGYAKGRYLKMAPDLGHEAALAEAKVDAAYMKEQFESGDFVDVEAEAAAKIAGEEAKRQPARRDFGQERIC